MRYLLATLVIFACAPLASAQCNLGVYADPNGTVGLLVPSSFSEFDIYVVQFVEDAVNAVTYNIDVPGLFDPVTNPSGNIIPVFAEYGPLATGINVEGPGGDFVGLGVCTNGFGGTPVLVAHYRFLYISTPSSFVISIQPNTDLGIVQYSTCAGELRPCEIGPSLLVDDLVAAEAPSWSAVKRLYD